MENIENLLSSFKAELKIYRKFQRLLGIKIDLDDKVEKEIETNNSREEMILIQKNFVEDTSDFLEEIYNDKIKRLEEINLRQDLLFNDFKTVDFYDNIFFNIFEDKYIV
jgi:hypothetical protein